MEPSEEMEPTERPRCTRALRPFRPLLLLLALAALSTACSPPALRGGSGGRPPIEGEASWYGAQLEGLKTASGEPFDPSALTAAHRTLPFGALVKVTNLENGRSVVVRVNDRGPFAHQRLIDLSRAAAEQLGFLKQGHARVTVEVLELPERRR